MNEQKNNKQEPIVLLDGTNPLLLQRELMRLSEEVVELRKDAERYRWLRNNDNAYPLFFIAQRSPQNIVVQFTGQFADQNIDAAMKGKQ